MKVTHLNEEVDLISDSKVRASEATDEIEAAVERNEAWSESTNIHTQFSIDQSCIYFSPAKVGGLVPDNIPLKEHASFLLCISGQS